MSLFQISAAAGIFGAPLAGLIIGMQSGLVGGTLGVLIGSVSGYLFFLLICRILLTVLRMAEEKTTNETNELGSLQSNSGLEYLVNEANSMIVVFVLLSPLLSIPVTIWAVEIALKAMA